MNDEEIQSLIKQLKAAGLNDEEIMDAFYEAFTDGEMDRKDLEALSEAMGYELTDDFKNDAQPDPINEEEGEKDISKGQIEDAKEIDENESPEEFKEKIGLDEEEEESTVDEEDDEENSEDSEWEQAQKMFKI